MKLSAPPPSPEPGPEPTPAAPPIEEVPTPAAVEPPAPVEKPPEKPATWPTWYGNADLVMSALAVALAFMAASFAARNSDLWLHLGTGKMLTTGEYKLGHDPFSYTAADRTWVNHNWLFDLGVFLLYRGDGFLLVLLKAIAVALTFVLILAIRRSGQPLWPWAVFSALAVLASVQQLALRPYVGSLFFLALTLLVVFRLPSRPGSWRLPFAIGVTFCLWANLDAWFFLGPVALALITIGEVIRRQMGPSDAAASDDLFGSLPDPATLGKALGIGILACMLNPHHFQIWDLPFELTGAEGVEADPRIKSLLFDPMHRIYWTNASLGGNANGIAYAILLLAGLYATFLSGAVGRLIGPAAEVDPLPLPYAILWVGFAVLSLLSMFAVPFFALVTVPLVASRWNVFSSRIVLHSWNDRRTQLLLTGSTAGRLLSIISLCALGLAAWPGWLHPPASRWWEDVPNPGIVRRVAWAVEPDDALRQTAEWLKDEREKGRLQPEARGLLTSIDQANYCAWYAPGEKVFANGRLQHHRKDLADLAKVRAGLMLFSEKAEAPDPKEAIAVFEKWNVSYVGIAVGVGDNEQTRRLFQIPLSEMLSQWPAWSPWYFNGRSAISGWRRSPARSDPTFQGLEIDPTVLAFGPEVAPLPQVKAEPPLLNQGTWDEFLRARRPAPSGAEECLTWLQYKQVQSARQGVKVQGLRFFLTQAAPRNQFLTTPQRFIAEAMEKSILAGGARNFVEAPWPPVGVDYTTPILALRAARRAIAENPDHPDGYFALAQALGDADLPISEAERNVARVTAYRQCFLRLPPPEEYKKGTNLTVAWQASYQLALIYLGQSLPNGEYTGFRVDAGTIGGRSSAGFLFRVPGPGGRANIARIPPMAAQSLPPGSQQAAEGLYLLPLDLARESLIKAEEYAKLELTDPESRPRILKSLEDQRKSLDSAVKKATEQFRQVAEQRPKLRDRLIYAIQLGLIGEALSRLREADLGKEFGDEREEVYLEDGPTKMGFRMIALELAVGRLEDAAFHLQSFKTELNEIEDKPNVTRARIETVRRGIRELDFQKLVLEGNYAEAGKEYETLEGRDIERYEKILSPDEVIRIAPLALIFPGAVTNPLGIAGWYRFNRELQYFQIRRQLANGMDQARTFFFRRGYLCLLEGDIAGAKKRFASVRRPALPAWDLPEATLPMADVYLRLIEAAEKRAAKP